MGRISVGELRLRVARLTAFARRLSFARLFLFLTLLFVAAWAATVVTGATGEELSRSWEEFEKTLAVPSAEFGIIAGGQLNGYFVSEEQRVRIPDAEPEPGNG